MFGNLGTTEILLVLAFVLLLFGAGNLPELAGGIGKAIRQIKRETGEIHNDYRESFLDQ